MGDLPNFERTALRAVYGWGGPSQDSANSGTSVNQYSGSRNQDFKSLQAAAHPDAEVRNKGSVPVAVARAEVLGIVVVPRAPADDFIARIVIAAGPLPDVAADVVQSPLRIAPFVRAHRAGALPIAKAEVASLAIPAGAGKTKKG